ADAQSLYERVLQDPAATADALVAGAEFFAAEKQPDIADKFLNRLDKAPFKPGALAVLRARLQQVGDQPEKAIATLVAASKEFPGVAQVWQELSGALLRVGKLNEADQAARDGAKATGGSSEL